MGGTTTITNLGNWPGVVTGQQSLDAADTAEALNDGTPQAVPDGATVAVRAQDNTGSVFIGDSSVTGSTGFELASGEGVSLNVQDVSTLHIVAPNAGDGVTWIVEVE